MRLNPAQIDAIQSTAHAVFGEFAQFTRFDSRLYDQQKGGAVGLYVEIAQIALMKKICCKTSPQDPHGLPVDLIIKPYVNHSPIALRAKQEGICL